MNEGLSSKINIPFGWMFCLSDAFTRPELRGSSSPCLRPVTECQAQELKALFVPCDVEDESSGQSVNHNLELAVSPLITLMNDVQKIEVLDYTDPVYRKACEYLGELDPNLSDEEGTSFLDWAMTMDDPSWLEFMLEQGADPNLPDARGDYPLFYALDCNNFGAFSRLLDCDDMDLEGFNSIGQTLLTAVMNHKGMAEDMRLSFVSRLLELGVDPRAKDAHGVAPIIHAVSDDDYAMTELLLGYGASPNELVVLSQQVFVPIFTAIAHGKLPIVRLLLAYGAQQKYYWETLANGSIDGELLGSVRVHCSCHAKDVADANGQEEIGQILQMQDLTVPGDTMLGAWVRANNLREIAAYLQEELEKRRDAAYIERDEDYQAVDLQIKENIVREIIDEQDTRGMTPLMLALQNGSFEIAKFLLSLGASTNLLDNEGNSVINFLQVSTALSSEEKRILGDLIFHSKPEHLA